MFYIFQWITVIACTLSAHYIGFTGFFVLVVVSSLMFIISWLRQLDLFLFSKSSEVVDLGAIFRLPGLSGHLSFFVDNVSYSFSLLTALIGLFVFVYAFSYMRFERNILNFLGLLKAFELSMVLLVLLAY